jgi:hypothetical protein
LGRWVASPGGWKLHLLLLALYLGVTAAGVVHHEPFRDEARRWLMARDAPSLAELLRNAPYEGPVLWSLVLRVPATLGLPYASLAWLNWLFAGAAAGLLLFLAPLPFPLKVGTLSSFVMLYEFAVPGRYYAFTIFLLFATIALYERRREHPRLLGAALVLVINSSVFGAVLAAPLVGFLAWEMLRERGSRRALLAPVVLAAAAVLLLAAQVVPPGDGRESTVGQGLAAAWDLSQVVPSLFFGFFSFCTWLPLATLGWIALGFLAVVPVGLAGRPRALAYYGLCTCAFLVILSRMGASPRHGGFLVVVVAASLWLAAAEDRERRGAPVPAGGAKARLTGVCLAAAVFLCLGAQGTVYVYRADWISPFSSSREMAGFLVANRLLGIPLAAHRSDNAASLLPYLPPSTKVYYPAMDQFRGYAGQDRPLLLQDSLGFEAAAARAFARFPRGARFLLLFNEGGHDPPAGRCALLHRTWPAIIRDETYWLYDCRGGA